MWVSGILLSLVCVAAAGGSRHKMGDPLFGIVYDPQEIHFEAAPGRLLKRCPALEKRYVKGWVYGHLKAGDVEYFLISGLMEYHDEPNGAVNIATDETGGMAVALRGTTCRMDNAEYFLSQKINPATVATPIRVRKSVLNGILQDAFRRYSTAFGGKQKFLKQVTPDAIGPRVVLEQLKVFEKERK